MNASTTNPLGNDFPKQVVTMLFNAIDEGTKQGYRMIWSAIKEILVAHWGMVLITLVLILLLAIVEYFVTKRWAMLGSVLYNYLYFGILFLIALIFGSDVFASDWFKIVLFIVYVVCFVAVGKFLRKIGVRR